MWHGGVGQAWREDVTTYYSFDVVSHAHGPGGRESCRRGEGARRRAARSDAAPGSQPGHVLRLLPLRRRQEPGHRDGGRRGGLREPLPSVREATANDDANAGNRHASVSRASLLKTMCGFAGLLSTAGFTRDELADHADRMIAPIAHRGPDDSGIWVDEQAGIALGFRRLAILDLSPHGHQPMWSPSGRFVIVFNGEVYNFGELRRELEQHGYGFRGHSDTEVILAAFEQWGIHEGRPPLRRHVRDRGVGRRSGGSCRSSAIGSARSRCTSIASRAWSRSARS